MRKRGPIVRRCVRRFEQRRSCLGDHLAQSIGPVANYRGHRRRLPWVAKRLHLVERPSHAAKGWKASDQRPGFSRLWLLKNKKLHYTWDFTFKGDIERAAELMGSLKITPLRETRVEQVETQVTKHKRGSVRTVSVMQ